MYPILDGYGVMGIFNSRTRPRVNRVLRNQLRCGKGGVGGYSPGQFILHDSATTYSTRNSRGSQPSGSLCCGRRWYFRKPALGSDQFKLKVILQLYFNCIMYYAGLLFFSVYCQ
jgi:hypothetical protein